MNITLVETINHMADISTKDKVVIVIDVLRATSVITTALANGAESVMPVIDIERAIEYKQNNVLLGGERKALKIEGFDLSNSPLEYKEEIVKDKEIIISTTNGTKAIHKAEGAESILIGAIINGKCVAKKASALKKDILILCAGTEGKFSLDDFLCAGKIIFELMAIEAFEMDDLSAVAYAAYRDNKNDLISYVSLAKHYKYLISIGFKEDIKYCFTEDLVEVVGVFKNGKIKSDKQ